MGRVIMGALAGAAVVGGVWLYKRMTGLRPVRFRLL